MSFLKNTKDRNGLKQFGFSLKSCLDQEKQKTVESNYRKNLSLCFKSLKKVLPVPLNATRRREFAPDVAQDDAYRYRYSSNARLLNDATSYIAHLESVVEDLIAASGERQLEKNNLASPAEQVKAKKIQSIRDKFLKNFVLDKAIFDYDFSLPTTGFSLTADFLTKNKVNLGVQPQDTLFQAESKTSRSNVGSNLNSTATVHNSLRDTDLETVLDEIVEPMEFLDNAILPDPIQNQHFSFGFCESTNKSNPTLEDLLFESEDHFLCAASSLQPLESITIGENSKDMPGSYPLVFIPINIKPVSEDCPMYVNATVSNILTSITSGKALPFST